jgi:hypothetical protein
VVDVGNFDNVWTAHLDGLCVACVGFVSFFKGESVSFKQEVQDRHDWDQLHPDLFWNIIYLASKNLAAVKDIEFCFAFVVQACDFIYQNHTLLWIL